PLCGCLDTCGSDYYRGEPAPANPASGILEARSARESGVCASLINVPAAAAATPRQGTAVGACEAVGGCPNGGGAAACGIDVATKRERADVPGRVTSSRYLGPGSPLPWPFYCTLPRAAGRGGRPCLGASLPVS